MNLAEAITICIPTSPVPSHPSASLIEQSIFSIRYHLPDCQILIQADGVRHEQEKFRKQYEAYLLRLDDGINAGKYGKAKIIRFPDFRHQAAMMKESIDLVETPLLFYLEHDFLMLPEYVDWKGIANAIVTGGVNLVRLYYWSSIIPEHWSLILDKEPIFVSGVPILRTRQWSQHPQIASVEFYKKILGYFSPDARTMIEDRIYGVVASAPWEEMRCSIYAPMPYLKREAHLHAREEQPKYEETFTF